MTYVQNTGHIHNVKGASEFLENVAKFIYVQITLTNQNCMHEDSESTVNSGNAHYHSVQNCLSSCLYLSI